MGKNTTVDGSGPAIVPSLYPLQTPGTEAPSDTWPALVAQEKARRQARSRQLDVLEYQPCAQDSALPLLQGWHLLFFAHTGSPQIAEIRSAALQQESERDVQLMQRVESTQAQFRQHVAQSSQTRSEAVSDQAVIAEICYGGLSIVPCFWLPAEMELGLSLIPATGARLALDAFTLVEHGLPTTSQSLDVLLVVASPPRTKAELVTLLSTSGDGLALERNEHVITLSTCFLGLLTPTADFAAGASCVDITTVTAITALGYEPLLPPTEEGVISLQALRLRNLGVAPSVSRLLEVRQQLLAGQLS
jgi:hypothetical protein